MDAYVIWQNRYHKLSQSYDFAVPGYLFVESRSDACSLDALTVQESQSLIAALQLAEHVLNTLIRPQRSYVLRFGESDASVHFHVIPRTAKLLAAYLEEHRDEPPYNGALITAWLWSNAHKLAHGRQEISAFIQAARQLCGSRMSAAEVDC